MEAKTKRSHGRPTKYDEKYNEMLIEHMAQGFSFESFAGVIEVNQDTLHEWKKVHPSFSEAKKIAFGKCQVFWEKIGIDGCWNTPDGPNLNTGVWVFNMKNRFRWTDKVEVNGSKEEEVKPIVLAYKI